MRRSFQQEEEAKREEMIEFQRAGEAAIREMRKRKEVMPRVFLGMPDRQLLAVLLPTAIDLCVLLSWQAAARTVGSRDEHAHGDDGLYLTNGRPYNFVHGAQ